ncbi:MAG: permease [Sporichthyaceae bacterium]
MSSELETRSAPRERGTTPHQESRLGLLLLCASLAALLFLSGPLREFFDRPALATWSTVFVSIVVQALPFLVFGVLLSASITTFVPESWFKRALPGKPAAAVPVAGMAGAILPGCECASVPVAASLIRRGVPAAAALAFLLSAPAINPVVLTATAVAFPDAPEMVVARFLASLLVAVVMGWLWLRFGRADMLERVHRRATGQDANRWTTFVGSVRHDLLHTGGFLVVGGLTAATLNVVVPREWMDAVAGNPVLSILCLALLAVVLAICSEADAFVAASLTQFSLTARLAFLVVGPTVDVKLIALQAGTFGRRFAMWFAPTTFVLAIGAAVLVGEVLL